MEKQKRRNGISFKGMCLLMGLVPLLVASSFIATLTYLMVDNNVRLCIEDSLQIATSNVNQYFAYDIIANGDVDYDEYSDHEFMESQIPNNVELTLYKGNINFLTSLKESGSYVEGSEMPAEVWNKISAGETYYAENENVLGISYFVCYEPVYDGNGNVWGAAFAAQKRSVFEAIIAKVIRNLTIIVSGLIVVCIAVVLVCARKLSSAIVKLDSDLTNLSYGDLHTDFTSKSHVKEVRNLTESGKLLQEKLGEIIGNVKDTANSLEETATKVEKLSNNAAGGAEHISDAVTELSTTAQGMASTVQDANTAIMEMGDVIDVISGSVSTMIGNSKETNAANEKAIKAMDKLQTASDKSAESIDSIRMQINDTNNAIEEIKTAADTISSISSETNLLALNASIEAARAGEAGRGFAVVAENIKKLAEESNESAGQIQDVINHIIEVSLKSVEMAEAVGAIVNEQKDALKDAYAQMEESKISNAKLSDEVAAIGTQADTLATIKENVLGNISDLSAVSEENAASSEEVNASVETIAEAVENTKTESEEVKVISDRLVEEMSYFK